MTDAAADLVALAVTALAEVTDPASVGPLVDAIEREPGVVDLHFACLAPAYAGWRWTVSTARLDDAEPTVLETELLPGDGALLAPPWVPWAERLAEYRRTHEHGTEHAADEDEDLDDEDDLEAEDDDDDGLDGDEDADERDDDVLDDEIDFEEPDADPAPDEGVSSEGVTRPS